MDHHSGRELVRPPGQRGRLRDRGQDRRRPAPGAGSEDLHLQPREGRVDAVPGSANPEVRVARWLKPDFKIVCVWPFGLLDYSSATLRCKI